MFKSEDPDAMMDFLVDHGLGLLTGPLTRMHLTSPELLLECEEADFARIGQNLPLALVLRLKGILFIFIDVLSGFFLLMSSGS